MCSFVRSFVRSFVPSYVSTFVGSFVRVFACLLVCCFSEAKNLVYDSDFARLDQTVSESPRRKLSNLKWPIFNASDSYWSLPS